jgi:hypothetical protein
MTSVLVVGDRGLDVRRFGNAGQARRVQAPIESDGLGASLMAVRCGWCGANIEAKVCEPAMAGKVSHGICPACQQKLLAGLPGVPRTLVRGEGLESVGATRGFGCHPADAASPAPSNSRATGADIAAAAEAAGPRSPQDNGTAGSPGVLSRDVSDEHAGARPAAVSAPPPRDRFWTVTGRDFGRAIAWARRQRNALNDAIRAKINEVRS